MESRWTPTLLTAALVVSATAGAATLPPGAAARPSTDVGGTVAPGTVWSLDRSPYLTTGNITVPAGTTLTIEPGVIVKVGAYHRIDVAGSLLAVGSADMPIRFEPAGTQAWSSIQLLAGSGHSEIGHAVLTGGGSSQREMLGIATDDAEVHDTRISEGKGLGIEVKDGKSPTIRDSSFYHVTSSTANPPAALRLIGQSNAVIADNFFQSNHEAVVWDADANPTFNGNRFDLNGYNGVRVSGRITRDVELQSLGPRAWAYWISGSGLDILEGGRLTIHAGSTLRLASAASIHVRGTLVVSGTAVAKVLLSDERLHEPGQWRDIRFDAESIDYDAATGTGSVIEHAQIEYGGSTQTGLVYIDDCSPRIANTTVRRSRYRGIGVRGADAHPQLVAVEVAENLVEDEGIGIAVTNGAAPSLSFSTIRDNFMGVHTSDGSLPRLGPHNALRGNATYSIFNADDNVCVDAAGNSWGAATGPLDQSPQTDACGQEDHRGDGDLVGDNVRYEPFEGQLQTPYVDRPRCGTVGLSSPEVSGFAPADARSVAMYDNQVEVGRANVETDGDGLHRFAFTLPLAPGSHVVQAQSVSNGSASALSAPLNLVVDPNALVDPGSLSVGVSLEGNTYVQGYLNEDGCATLSNDNGWAARPLIGPPITLGAAIACPSGASPVANAVYLGADHPMSATGDGRLAATFEQGGGGTFAIRVDCDGQVRTLEIGTINPSTDGFVSDAVRGVLHRVTGATVTLLVKLTSTGDFVRWDGASYFGQTNPQVTGPTGRYAFYPPPGTYMVEAEAEGYHPFRSSPVDVVTQPVMAPIALQPEVSGWAFLPAVRRGDR